MAKIEGVIKSEIVRLAKREIRSVFLPLRRDVRQMSLKLSGLSKGIRSLNRLAKELRLGEAKPKLEATPEEVKASRLSPERISRLRRKLGISQREMGIVIGASLGAVAMWEKGKFRPKPDKKAAIVALRKLRKRDVKKILAQKAGGPEKPKQKVETRSRRKKKEARFKKVPQKRKISPPKTRKAK